jgi:hypothetical protein
MNFEPVCHCVKQLLQMPPLDMGRSNMKQNGRATVQFMLFVVEFRVQRPRFESRSVHGGLLVNRGALEWIFF